MSQQQLIVLFSQQRCNMLLHHMRAVGVCDRQSGQAQQSPHGNKGLVGVHNLKTEVCKSCQFTVADEGYASLISCPVNSQQTDLRPADPRLNDYRGKRALYKVSHWHTITFCTIVFVSTVFIRGYILGLASCLTERETDCKTKSSCQVKVVNNTVSNQNPRGHEG